MCNVPAGVHSPQLLLQLLRSVKSTAEVALMKQAGDLTGHAFKQVSQSVSQSVGRSVGRYRQSTQV